MTAEWVRIVEVGPRDGLQNEPERLSTTDKVAFVDALARAGLREIEVSSFVSPRWVPQLADAAEVFAAISRIDGVIHAALVPNEKGLERALDAGVDKVAVFAAVTETFSRKNTNGSIDEVLARFPAVVRRARDAGAGVRGYVSVGFHCPFEGPVRPERTADVVRRLVDMGVDEISLGDTIGKATPPEVDAVLDLVQPGLGAEQLALHMHDTYGMGLLNVHHAWQRGVRVFDASAGGLGGCPYAPGASGNLATEDLVFLFDGLGVETGVDLDGLVDATAIMERALGRVPPGRVYRSLRNRKRHEERES